MGPSLFGLVRFGGNGLLLLGAARVALPALCDMPGMRALARPAGAGWPSPPRIFMDGFHGGTASRRFPCTRAASGPSTEG